MYEGDEIGFRLSPGRGPAVAAEAMVATSQVPATLAGLRVLGDGGNAADAAIAAAAVLCVAEPMSTGLGGDAFAIVAAGGRAHGLDAAGPAPARAPRRPVPDRGPASAVVPGAVAGWAALSERFGRLGLDSVLSPAIDLARSGVAAGFHCARAWRRATPAPAELGPAPRVGQPFRLPELARSLSRVADSGPAAIYEGEIARAIAASTWLGEEDLASYEGAAWVEPLRKTYRGVEVVELPPPTQGVAALEALGLLESLPPTLPNRVRAVALALEDAFERVRDGADVGDLLSPAHLAERLGAEPRLRAEPRGGTVYLCCVDGDGMAVSFIQSIFGHFGSGVVAPGTGIVINNRAACFEVGGEVIAGRRPYQTTIPGMLFEGGAPRGAFGVMGGYIQAQAHAQLVCGLVDDGLDPQAALDQPRFRVDAGRIALEEGLGDQLGELEARGWTAAVDRDRERFGGGQAILIEDDHLRGGSDPRKDGCAAGY